MRTGSFFIVNSMLAMLIVGTSSVDATDSLDYLKQLLNNSARLEVSADDQAAGDGSLRVAQRANVNSVRTKQSEGSHTAIGATVKTVDERKAEQEERKIESKINRQISALERSLEKEEAALEARLLGLSKKREIALEKGDEKQLEKIQSMEASVIKDYEKRIERILAAAATKSEPAPGTRSRSPRSESAKPRPESAKARQQSTKQVAPNSQPPRRRFRRLWPFS